MDFLQVVLTLGMGFLLGCLVTYSVRSTKVANGQFLIRKDEEGKFSYVLQLEEEPERLHNRSHIVFKVTKEQ